MKVTIFQPDTILLLLAAIVKCFALFYQQLYTSLFFLLVCSWFQVSAKWTFSHLLKQVCQISLHSKEKQYIWGIS
jgi:hypothetical protein